MYTFVISDSFFESTPCYFESWLKICSFSCHIHVIISLACLELHETKGPCAYISLKI